MAMAMSTAMAGLRSLHLLGEPLHRHQRALFGAAAREENLAGASSSGLYVRGILSSSGLCVSGVLRSSFVPCREVVERRCGVVVVEVSSIGGAAGDGGGGSEELGFEGAVPETVSGEAKLAERLQLGEAAARSGVLSLVAQAPAGEGFPGPVPPHPSCAPALGRLLLSQCDRQRFNIDKFLCFLFCFDLLQVSGSLNLRLSFWLV